MRAAIVLQDKASAVRHRHRVGRDVALLLGRWHRDRGWCQSWLLSLPVLSLATEPTGRAADAMRALEPPRDAERGDVAEEIVPKRVRVMVRTLRRPREEIPESESMPLAPPARSAAVHRDAPAQRSRHVRHVKAKRGRQPAQLRHFVRGALAVIDGLHPREEHNGHARRRVAQRTHQARDEGVDAAVVYVLQDLCGVEVRGWGWGWGWGWG